jgi:hypothetical protein
VVQLSQQLAPEQVTSQVWLCSSQGSPPPPPQGPRLRLPQTQVTQLSAQAKAVVLVILCCERAPLASPGPRSQRRLRGGHRCGGGSSEGCVGAPAY